MCHNIVGVKIRIKCQIDEHRTIQPSVIFCPFFKDISIFDREIFKQFQYAFHVESIKTTIYLWPLSHIKHGNDMEFWLTTFIGDSNSYFWAIFVLLQLYYELTLEVDDSDLTEVKFCETL